MNVHTFFKLMSDRNRLEIVKILGSGEKSVGELSEILNSNQSLVSHHLKKLREHNIVKSEVRGQKRIYSLTDRRIYDKIVEIENLLMEIAKESLGEIGKEKIIRENIAASRDVEERLKNIEREFSILFGERFAKRFVDDIRMILNNR